MHIYSLYKINIITRKVVNNMPNLDGTGPQGAGPRTGRGYGRCGYTRGFCNYCNCPMQNASTVDAKTLENEQKMLEDELEAVKKEIAKINS